MFRFELSAILKALGFAGNSMTCETAFSMGALLGFTPTRPSVYMESCMIGSSYKTFTGIQEMHIELAGKATDSSSLHIAYAEIRPPGWDAPAFCSNLFYASQFNGLRHGSQCKVALARVIYEWSTNTVRFVTGPQDRPPGGTL